MSNVIHLIPIAVVKSRFSTNTPVEELRAHPSQIILRPEFEPGLMGLEAGMDIIVIFYFHKIKPNEVELQLHPGHNPDNPKRGVFATRTQFRPNSMGVSVVHIEAIEGNKLTVQGLDALDGTPILDIKPHTPYFDTDSESQKFEVKMVHSLEEARDAIDLIDAELIRLLGNRAKYVHQVVNFKDSVEDIHAPDRYAEVMQSRREMAKEAELNPDIIEQMYRLLVDNFIKEELEILAHRKKEPKKE